MKARLERSSLAEQVAGVIKKRLAHGEWKVVMPSYRGLATLLQVSRSTLESAFQILEEEGILQTRPKKRALVVRPPPARRTAGFYRVGWLDGCPLSQISSSELRNLLFLQIAQLEAHQEFELIPIGMGRDRFSPTILQRFLKRSRASHWVLVNQPESVLNWFAAQQLNACVLGACPPAAASLSSLNLGRVAAVRHVSGLLQARGHRRILLLTSRYASYDQVCVEQAFASSGSPAGARLQIMRHDATVAGLQVKLVKVFQESRPPDALIVVGGVFALTAYSTLLAALRLRLPEDVSFVSLDSDLSFSHLSPQPAHYTWGLNGIARRLFQLLQRMGQNASTRRGRLLPVFVPGDTLRPENLA